MSRPFDPGFYGGQPATHGLSYFLLPLAVIIVTWYWTLMVPATDLIVVVARVVSAAMSANAVIAVAQLSTGKAAVLEFLPRFWGSALQVDSVAAHAAGGGRYTGIFDQPAEAGLAYGLALLCVIFLGQRGGRRSWLMFLCAVAVITGGVLSVSKVFLLGALPAAAIVVLRGRVRMRVILSTGCAAAGFWLLASTGIFPAWPGGAAAIGHLTSPSTEEWTGVRYGARSSLAPAVTDVLHASPWYGFGATGINVPYDSLWLEALALAGIVGVLLVAALLGVLGWQWIRAREALGRPEWLLAGASLILATGASLGFPSFTADRAGTLLWLILGLLICAPTLDEAKSVMIRADPRPPFMTTTEVYLPPRSSPLSLPS
jgi:hypothetical protein